MLSRKNSKISNRRNWTKKEVSLLLGTLSHAQRVHQLRKCFCAVGELMGQLGDDICLASSGFQRFNVLLGQLQSCPVQAEKSNTWIGLLAVFFSGSL